jgi:hypothetical protein
MGQPNVLESVVGCWLWRPRLPWQPMRDCVGNVRRDASAPPSTMLAAAVFRCPQTGMAADEGFKLRRGLLAEVLGIDGDGGTE